ncbi:glucose-6-phosphate isomerase [Ralstonia solanacearum]|uniref:Glucose-6-phosphate isomerase n=2 Tax=Ralstonia solanacearum species complex TaxID=3116862 RepID=A0A0S4V3R2_RALSL|nr:glucose-6-phosphate isomerase [Ralstonia pseudosolanacearum]APC68600.1 glucose-6-phosphate isomerase [Ralstonia solanacearum OE1-1]OIN69030.1 glucose-6-phosphate isomerase [Ralstonia solanacearum]API74729.1 glucose-6-phosphate isomerase [Ralstonia pseudosolanacearum]ASL74863.1 glucose-6-phosphate isomerase [Ralstonia pseudosolanacearum]MCK4120693.1 glucose-6-phosphate isomerase [Ralstonia pseudosolanacearum]
MPTALPAWQSLSQHAQAIRATHMRDWFAAPDAEQRVHAFTVEAAGLTLDYAKNRITPETLALLLQLADEAGVLTLRDAMLRGERINNTEHRSVLHAALRGHAEDGYRADGAAVMPDVLRVRAQMRDFAQRVHSGTWTGHAGQRITDVVNIGIGGSDLGPRMVCRALAHLAVPQVRVHFVSNVDGTDLAETLAGLNPDTTLAIVCSKTFTTLETMANAHSMRRWFIEHGVPEAQLKQHFVAVSTNRDAVVAFGIDPDNMFTFWDWVGGRFSLWSAVGLSIVLAIGPEQFEAMLDGARAMDRHFATAAPRENMPLILGLLSVWYRGFFGAASACTVPYCAPLELLTDFMQQLEMESNGKSVQRNGAAIGTDTGPIVWGTAGTNGQHAYFQLIHQGSQIVPVDFITTLEPVRSLPGHHAKLLANCFAQGEALLRGRTAEEVRADGITDAALVPHMVFEGNRPSNTILMQRLDAASLGALIACAEHRTFVQGAVWNINSFDQWGVELGKKLAKPILEELEGAPASVAHDASTAALIRRAKAAR